MTVEKSPINRELLVKLLPKLDYAVLLGAVQQVAPHVSQGLPELPAELNHLDDDDLVMENLHLVLFDVHVMEGNLVCPDTKRKFPIKEGIPNMVLHEDEL